MDDVGLDPPVAITQSELMDMIADVSTKASERAVLKCVVIALDKCAEQVDGLTVTTNSPAARIGAEVALRQVAALLRKSSQVIRESADQTGDDGE